MNYHNMLSLLNGCLENGKNPAVLFSWFEESREAIEQIVNEAKKGFIVSGKEIREFWFDDDWWASHDDWFVEQDDGTVLLEEPLYGKWCLDSGELYNLNHIGPLMWQGDGSAPKPYGVWEFIDAYNEWKKEKGNVGQTD